MPLIARVALNLPIDREFDYSGGDLTPGDIGRLAVVPLGSRRCLGLVRALTASTAADAATLKDVIKVYRYLPALSRDTQQLLEFCARYYHYPLGAVAAAAVPTAAGGPPALGVRLTPAGRALQTSDLPARAPLQQRLLAHLQARSVSPVSELAALSKGCRGVLRTWQARGWVENCTVEESTPAVRTDTTGLPVLNPEQEAAVAGLRSNLGRYHVGLLLGITGSGKTEVYLRLIAEVLAGDGQALVLVPEINLTPQLEAAFRDRFPGIRLSVLSSAVSPARRTQNWLAAAQGGAHVVLGTRLAVFTPLPRLRLIVVDEEHDASFKQREKLRYSARDLAIFRARQAGVPVILASATPSLESYRNALMGRYGLYELRRRGRADAVLPALRLVNTRVTRAHEGLSSELLSALRERLGRGEQSLIFLNRRGYAPVLLCQSCGWSADCPRCSCRLVLHAARRLHCHHCGHARSLPEHCPTCGNADLRPVGQGTQRLELSLRRLFPGARIARADRDSLQGKTAWEELAAALRGRELDIVLGTQVLAKGHDFPHITLVGVVNADAALYAPDFRACERLFAQLVQVAGRAGRGAEPGEVIVQTAFPDHPLFRALTAQDYPAYARDLLAERKAAGFPPYAYQAVLRAEARQLDEAVDFLRRARGAANAEKAVALFDPVEAPMVRLAGRERAHLLVQATSRTHLQRFLTDWRVRLRELPAAGVRWILEVDPADL